MKHHINKAVFPVAGLGTRFLPATKANPKEMLPIVDKPLIQYAVEEAVSAGITELIFVTSSSKRAIEDHFDRNHALEAELARKNQIDTLSLVRNILPSHVNCVYVRQAEALGLGHAVLCAEHVVGNNAFAVILADDLIDHTDAGCMTQMVQKFEQYQNTILGVEQIPKDHSRRYGIIAIANSISDMIEINGIVEKPRPEKAPSNMAVVGRYILTPRIFHHIRHIPKGAGGEIQLTDAIAELLKEEKVYAYPFKGKRYDCGSKMGYLQAVVEMALKHPELGESFRDYLKNQPA